MGRTLNDVVAALPEARRARVEARARELIEEVESLSELRRMAGKAQVEIASALRVKQPSISKIENRRTCISRRFEAMSRRSAESWSSSSACLHALPYGSSTWAMSPQVFPLAPGRSPAKRQTKPRASAASGNRTIGGDQ